MAALAAGALASVFNLYLRALGQDAGFIGTLLTLTGAGAAVGVGVGGWATDRVGARAVLLAASLVTASGILAQLLAADARVLLAAGCVSGAGAAAYYVAAAPFLERSRGAAGADRVFSLDAALTLGATAVGSAAGGQAATALLAAGAVELAAYRATLFGAAAIGATSFLFLVLTRTDTTWRRTRGSAAALGATRADAAADRGAARWVAVLREPAALKLAACAALVSLGAGLFAPYQNLFFVEELGAAPAVYGWLSAAATLTRLVATLAAPGMARRLGTGRAIGWTQLTSVPLLLLVGFGPGLGVVAPAFLVRGALMNMAAPLHVSLRMGVLPAAIHGAGNALITLSDQVVRTGSTWLGGQAIQHAGYRPAYAASAASYIASAVLFLMWFGREKDATRR